MAEMKLRLKIAYLEKNNFRPIGNIMQHAANDVLQFGNCMQCAVNLPTHTIGNNVQCATLHFAPLIRYKLVDTPRVYNYIIITIITTTTTLHLL